MIPNNIEPSSYTPQYDIPFFNDVTYRYALQAPSDNAQITMGADAPLLHAMIRGGAASAPAARPMSMSTMLAQAPCASQHVERYGYVSPGQGYISRTGDGISTPCPHTTDAAYNDSPCARTSNYQGYVNTYGNWSSPTTGEHPQCMQAQPDIPREMYAYTERYGYVSPGQGYISRTGDGISTPCPHTTDAAYNDSPCARTSNYQGYVNTYGNWSSPTTGEHPQCMQAQPDIPREMYAYTVANNEPIIEEYCNCHQGANVNSNYSGFYQPYFCENCTM
jgi:hypothetical protein